LRASSLGKSLNSHALIGTFGAFQVARRVPAADAIKVSASCLTM